MPRWVDLTGQKFGRLAIVSYVGINPKNNGSVWNVLCDCGTTKMVAGVSLRSGNTQSCGCLNRERVSARHTTHGATANKKANPEYQVWQAMIARCHNETDKAFKNYGARGITVCDQWRHSYATFIADMGSRPTPKHTIERKENNSGYSPENCVWDTRHNQSRNHRRNRMLTYAGRTQCLTDWAKELNLTVGAMNYRVRENWSEEMILNTPMAPRKGRRPTA